MIMVIIVIIVIIIIIIIIIINYKIISYNNGIATV